MPLYAYLLLFFSVAAAGIAVYFFKPGKAAFLKLSLSFSGAYLFAISILDLIPEVYADGGSKVGIFILAGFFFQVLLEFFSEGIEHGHIHVHHHKHGLLPVSLMISLCVHSFLEGMPLANDFTANQPESPLLTGIVLHHLPVAYALVSLLIQSGIGRSRSLAMLLIFAAMSPLGALFSTLLGEELNLTGQFNNIMAFITGIFLHISTTILFETGEHHRYNMVKMATMIAGALLAFAQIM